MALTPLQRQKIQRYLPWLIAAIILASAIVIWQGLYHKEKPVLIEPFFQPRKIKINFETLEEPILKELQPFEEIKPFEETALPGQKIGRENPFLPY